MGITTAGARCAPGLVGRPRRVRTPVGPTSRRPRRERPEPLHGEIRAGVAAIVPFLVGLAPFALVIGATAAEQGDPFAGWAGAWLVYGGSAQLAALRALPTGLAAAVATGILVNARLVVYSASLARRWRDQPLWFRAVAAAMVVEPTWAAAERRADRDSSPRAGRVFFLTAGVALGVGWSGLIAVGALAGTRLGRPELGVAVPLCLAALIGPMLIERANRVPIVVGAVVALFTDGLPAGTGLLAAIAAASVAGVVVDSLGGADR